MDVVNITEVKAKFSQLVEKAARGEPFIIAKAGKPLVKVLPMDQSSKASSPSGAGQGEAPDETSAA